MKVLFMGTPEFAAGTLSALIDAGHEIVGVVTQPDRPSGRGKRMQYSPVKEVALKHDLPVLQPRRIKDEEVIRKLETLQADIGVIVAFGQILPQSVLDMPAHGCLNVHASLLPAYRGAAPIQWSIIDGCAETGVTIMKMDAGLDTGDIVTQKTIPITEDETAGSLHDKLAHAGAELLVETLPAFAAGDLRLVPQGDTTTAYAKMLTKEMGQIDWNRPAEEIERLIRGLSPWPSAYTILNGKNFKIWKAAAVKEENVPENTAPGTIVIRTNQELLMKTGDGLLSLQEVQMEGKRRMEIADFLRGTQELDFS